MRESWIDKTGRRSDPTRNETSEPVLRTPSAGVGGREAPPGSKVSNGDISH